MSRKTKKEYKSITVRMEKKHFDAIEKIAEGRSRSLNFIMVELLVKILRIEDKI